MAMTALLNLTIALLAVVPAAQQAVDQTTGSLAGSVLDSAGLSVAGAVVEYHNARKFVRDSVGHIRVVGPIIDATVRTDAAGEFLITGLPPGDYGLCAAGVLAAHLRSCDWGGPQPIVNLAAGQAAAAPPLALRTGALVTIEVSDPNGRIAAGERFVIGVVSRSGEYYRAKPTLSAAMARSYQVAVPMRASVYLLLDTSLRVTDQADQTVATGVRGPLVSLGTSTEVVVVLNIQ